jgi:hypothetical protein
VHIAAELLVVAFESLHELLGRDDSSLLLGVLNLHVSNRERGTTAPDHAVDWASRQRLHAP